MRFLRSFAAQCDHVNLKPGDFFVSGIGQLVATGAVLCSLFLSQMVLGLGAVDSCGSRRWAYLCNLEYIGNVA